MRSSVDLPCEVCGAPAGFTVQDYRPGPSGPQLIAVRRMCARCAADISHMPGFSGIPRVNLLGPNTAKG